MIRFNSYLYLINSIKVFEGKMTRSQKYFITVVVVFLVLALLIVVKTVWFRQIPPGNIDYMDMIISSIIAGLAGVVSIAAYYLAKNLNVSVDNASEILKMIEKAKEQIKRDLDESLKSKEQANFLLDGTFHMVLGSNEKLKIEDESVKKSIADSIGLTSSSWASATPNRVFGDSESEFLHKRLWSSVINTYSLEESYDISKLEVATNARNYLYTILSTISELFRWREKWREDFTRMNGKEMEDEYPKIHYFVCTSVPPDYYFNFPHKVNQKHHCYSHPRILAFTIAMEAIVRRYVQTTPKILEVSRVVLTPESKESKDLINTKASAFYWPEFTDNSIYDNILKRLRKKFVLNITIPGLESYIGKMHNAIPKSSFEFIPEEGNVAWQKPFIAMSDESKYLMEWLGTPEIERIKDEYKNTIQQNISHIKQEIESNKSRIYSLLYDRIMKLFKKIETEFVRCFEMKNEMANPLEFFNDYHILESFLIQILKDKPNIDGLDDLFNKIMYLWQIEWLIKDKPQREDQILSVKTYWEKYLHSDGKAFFADPKLILDDPKLSEKIWPNFTLFGIQKKDEDIKWLFNLAAKTDSTWNTSLLKFNFCNPDGTDDYVRVKNKLIDNRLKERV